MREEERKRREKRLRRKKRRREREQIIKGTPLTRLLTIASIRPGLY